MKLLKQEKNTKKIPRGANIHFKEFDQKISITIIACTIASKLGVY
jgi:hypothetical protein